MSKSHMERNWGSLTDFKNYLEKNLNEKVVFFDGAKLVTNKYRYTLVFGRLYRYDR